MLMLSSEANPRAVTCANTWYVCTSLWIRDLPNDVNVQMLVFLFKAQLFAAQVLRTLQDFIKKKERSEAGEGTIIYRCFNVSDNSFHGHSTSLKATINGKKSMSLFQK